MSILLCLTTIGGNAAKSGRDIKIQNPVVEKAGEELHVRFTAEIPKGAVKRNYQLTLFPVISKDGLSKDMNPIVVDSRRSKINKRIEYEAVVQYQTWMDGSMLRIDRKLAGCCTEETLQPELLIQKLEFTSQ